MQIIPVLVNFGIMTLQTRRIIFYSLVFSFIIIGITAIFYSNGWRFNLETFTINKLGGIFFESVPSYAMVSIGKTNLNLKQNFLYSSLLVANLFPKSYTVKITKEGYQEWTKNLEVNPSLVSEAPAVILLPEKPSVIGPIFNGVKDFWIDEKNEEGLAILKQNGFLEINSHPIVGETVVDWSADGKSLITKNKRFYFLIDLNKTDEALNLSLAFQNLKSKSNTKKIDSITQIQFLPPKKNKFLITTGQGLYLLDTQIFSIENLHSGTVPGAIVKNSEIIFASSTEIIAYNFLSEFKEKIVEFKKIMSLAISPSGNYLAILDENKSLYLLERKLPSPQKISDGVRTFKFSPDSQKIALVKENGRLEIYKFTADSLSNLKNLTFQLGSIEANIVWHKNSDYLFIKYPSQLYLLEVTSLSPINFQHLDLENTKYYYAPNKNLVYLLKGAGLYSFDLK